MQKFCTTRSEGNRLSHYPWWLLLLILGGIHSALNAQEYRLEWGGIASVNSYLGDANRVIPFASVGGGVGAQMRYNHNFALPSREIFPTTTFMVIAEYGTKSIPNKKAKSTLRLTPYYSPLEGNITSLLIAINTHFSTHVGGVPTLPLGYP